MSDSTPLDIAMLLQRCGREVARDPQTGLYAVDGPVCPIYLTLAQYEAGLKVLDLRQKAPR